MALLQLTVRWLAPQGTAAYHGVEWPPTPARVFRALLAGAHRPGGAGERGVDALRRLEALPPPEIIGPPPERSDPVRAAVPNNDGDRILHEYQAGRATQARHVTSRLRTLRLRPGWRVAAPVCYRWNFPAPDPDPAVFSDLAAGLTVLGQGTDLVIAEAAWINQETPGAGLHWRPRASGSRAFAVPSPGEVDRLAQHHHASRRRIQATLVRSVGEPPVARQYYADPLALPVRRWQAFLLRQPDDFKPWSVPAAEALRVAAMMRHAVHQAAITAGLSQDAVTALMGHGDGGRIQVLPLPNVGHRWADGRVRRVMVSAEPTVPEDHWQAVLRRLVQAELVPVNARDPVALLQPVTGAQDRLLWRYVEPAYTWHCASPVILPGYTTRRGKPRPARAARRLLQHAGIPPAAVRAIHLSPTPGLPSVPDRRALRVPQHLQAYPRTFVRLEFHQPVTGPLLLGAGAGYGFGLLIHRERSGDHASPRQRSRPQDAAMPDR